MAVCIPISLWVISGISVSKIIFQLDTRTSVFVALACGLIIGVVEGVVIISPRSRGVAIARTLIAIVMAIIGAITFDLVLFDREVKAELVANKKEKIQETYAKRIDDQEKEVHSKKADWDQKLSNAVCEGDGTCGTGQRNLGPRYKALKKEADDAKDTYRKAEESLFNLRSEQIASIERINEYSDEVKNAGLLDRVAALHERISRNRIALSVFLLFFFLVFAFELMVLSVKLAFGETIDDKKEEMEVKLEKLRLESYLAAITSPVRHAKYCADRALS